MLDQEELKVVLLQVDEGRAFVVGLGEEVEAVDLLVAQEDFAFVPDDAFGDAALAATEPI